jgi:hypothetical protein
VPADPTSALPVGAPIPDAGLPTPDAGGGAAGLPAGDPTTALGPVSAAVTSASTGATDAACGAASQASAVPTQAGTTAFLTAASTLPPSVTTALLPVLIKVASATGGSGATSNPVCPADTTTTPVTGDVGGPQPGGATASLASTSGSGGAGANVTAANPTSGTSGSGGGASLAFTGAMTWVLALVGLVLALTGAAALHARRFFGSV